MKNLAYVFVSAFLILATSQRLEAANFQRMAVSKGSYKVAPKSSNKLTAYCMDPHLESPTAAANFTQVLAGASDVVVALSDGSKISVSQAVSEGKIAIKGTGGYDSLTIENLTDGPIEVQAQKNIALGAADHDSENLVHLDRDLSDSGAGTVQDEIWDESEKLLKEKQKALIEKELKPLREKQESAIEALHFQQGDKGAGGASVKEFRAAFLVSAETAEGIAKTDDAIRRFRHLKALATDSPSTDVQFLCVHREGIDFVATTSKGVSFRSGDLEQFLGYVNEEKGDANLINLVFEGFSENEIDGFLTSVRQARLRNELPEPISILATNSSRTETGLLLKSKVEFTGLPEVKKIGTRWAVLQKMKTAGGEIVIYIYTQTKKIAEAVALLFKKYTASSETLSTKQLVEQIRKDLRDEGLSDDKIDFEFRDQFGAIQIVDCWPGMSDETNRRFLTKFRLDSSLGQFLREPQDGNSSF